MDTAPKGDFSGIFLWKGFGFFPYFDLVVLAESAVESRALKKRRLTKREL
jgi:hypothetical protein